MMSPCPTRYTMCFWDIFTKSSKSLDRDFALKPMFFHVFWGSIRTLPSHFRLSWFTYRRSQKNTSWNFSMMCRKRALVMSVLSNQIQLDVSKIGVYHGISHGLEIMRIIICVSNRFQGTQVSDKPSCSKFKAAFFSKNCTRMWIIHFQIDFFLPSQWMGLVFHVVSYRQTHLWSSTHISQ